MTEFLLSELGRSPSSDRFADREGYALACGLSLGLINLGKGASRGMAGVADLNLEQKLHRSVPLANIRLFKRIAAKFDGRGRWAAEIVLA